MILRGNRPLRNQYLQMKVVPTSLRSGNIAPVSCPYLGGRRPYKDLAHLATLVS